MTLIDSNIRGAKSELRLAQPQQLKHQIYSVMAHLVMVPMPLYGHIFPMIHLSVQLAALGNKVTFITTSRTRFKTISSLESVLSQNTQADRVRQNLKFKVLSGDDSSEEIEQGGEAGIMANMSWMFERIDQVDQLVESSIQEQGPMSCLVLDFLAVRFKQLADSRGATLAAFWSASPVYFLVLRALEDLVKQGHLPLKENVASNIISDIPGVEELCNYKDIPFSIQECYIGGFRLEKMLEHVKDILEAPLLLFNTISELDRRVLDNIRELKPEMITVGPLVPMPVTNNPPPDDQLDIFTWLDTKPASSVLYVSFGTLAEISSEQIQELAQALQEMGHNFLWVVRLGQAQQSASFLDEFRQKTVNRGLLVSWCAQPQVLRHPSVGGFVTHCGWNSILESLSCGVPMLGWPCIAEQNLNAKYVAEVWRVGSRIITKNPDGSVRLVSKTEITEAIETVMVNPAIRERAAQAAKLAAERAGDSWGCNHLQNFLDSLI